MPLKDIEEFYGEAAYFLVFQFWNLLFLGMR